MEVYATSLAVLFAGLLTYCDLDAVFDAPPHALKWSPWLRLKGWWWGFILLNSALAGFLYFVFKDKEFLKDLHPLFAGILVGGSYTAFIRLKFTTLPNNTPFGLEAFYQGLRDVVHRRINRIIRAWRVQESQVIAQAGVAQLRERAILMVGSDVLLSETERTAIRAWIEKTATDQTLSESDRRIALALYIVTERKP